MITKIDLARFKTKVIIRLSKIIGHPLIPPVNVYWTVTGECNLRCKMCNLWKTLWKTKDGYTYDKAKCYKIIDEIAQLKISHLIISGGEALLFKEIFEIIRYAKEGGIKKVSIVTNGTLINEENAHNIVRSGVDEITFSIDGLEADHDFLRGKGVFKKAVKAIRLVREEKIKMKKNNLLIGITTLVQSRNYYELPELVKLAKNLGCDFIIFQPMLVDNAHMKNRNEKKELWISQEHIGVLEKNLKEVLKMKQQKEYASLLSLVNSHQLFLIKKYYKGDIKGKDVSCYEGYLRMVINEWGQYWMCGGDYGYLNEIALKDAWFSQRADKLRAEIKKCNSPCLQNCVLEYSVNSSIS